MSLPSGMAVLSGAGAVLRPRFVLQNARDMSWDLVGGIVVAVLFIVALYFLLRFLGKRSFLMSGSSHMRVVDRVSLSKDAHLVLVEIGGKVYALCVTKDGARAFADFDAESFYASGEADRPRGGDGTADGGDGVSPDDPFLKRFGKHFLKNLKKQVGIGEKPGSRPPQSRRAGEETLETRRTPDFSELLREEEVLRSYENPAGPSAAGPEDNGDTPDDGGEADDEIRELMHRIDERKSTYTRKTKRDGTLE
ncbi:flagellar biosynthetic protein FliO [Oscillospiraceae bacterium OttesenSCG-928-F05]|nr:flagellar biosynthetic protein FliO [Oscillospiraceae bacterium OttesenSCG-928-F05]